MAGPVESSNTVTMINLHNLSKIFSGSSTASVDQLDLQIDEGELLCLLGPSGCGKSTTLRMIAGLETPTTGRIDIRDATVDDVAAGTRVPAERRDLGLVFQNYALWPHLKVRDNVGFGPMMQRVSKTERTRRVDNALTTLGIADYADRYPSDLSGGQQQRVAIARTLAARPSVMLLDEPLSNLDARLRLEMRAEFQRIHRDVGVTMVFVTHDQWEAMTMATRIVVMNKGRIEQTGTPLEIYQRPVSRFVAEFMGSPPINMIELVNATQSATTQMLKRYLGRQRDEAASVGIRPEALHFARGQVEVPTDAVALQVTVSAVVPTGGTWIIETTDGAQRIFGNTTLQPDLRPGETLTAWAYPGDVHAFDPAGLRLTTGPDYAPTNTVVSQHSRS